MFIQPCSMEVDWPEIWRLMAVSTMFIFTHTAFLLIGAELFDTFNLEFCGQSHCSSLDQFTCRRCLLTKMMFALKLIVQ